MRGTLAIWPKAFVAFAVAGLAGAPGHAPAQGLYNDSNIYIDNVNMFVDGEMINEGRFDNDGTVSFTGDWQSEGKYSGMGIVEASGNGPQKISNGRYSIGSFVIDGWGTKYVKGSLTISNRLELKQGIVEVSAGDELIMDANARVFGGSTDAYVDGPLTVTGSGYKFFPLGKNGTYAPIEFLDAKADAARYAVEVFEDAPATSVENVIVRDALYWQRTDVEGTFGSSRVAIDYNDNSFHNPENIILVSGWDWSEPFAVINDIDYSKETDKISTLVPVSAPIILLGEVSEKWEDADFYLSTALSPHALHSENQTVKIFGDRLSSEGFRFQVFNRWGNVVFETTSLQDMSSRGWDGHAVNGAVLASGVYPYRLSALDRLGKTFEKKGIITIIH